MKSHRIAVGFVACVILAIALISRDQQSARACNSSPPCIVSSNACLKTMVLGKAIPLVIVVPVAVPVVFGAPATLFIACPTNSNCGTPCPGGAAVPIAASLKIALYPFPAVPPLPPATVFGAISTAAGTMAMPTCSDHGTFNGYVVPIAIPPGTPFGVYSVIGTAVVTFSDGTVLTQTGDQIVCLVEPAPGRPTVPRLDMVVVTNAAFPSPMPHRAPGDQSYVTYKITNNDSNYSVTLLPIATSKQVAVKPQGGNESQGVYAISNPYGDDFPIAFGPIPVPEGCVPLPFHPYHQMDLTNPPVRIPPGVSTNITVRIRSFGKCRSGSCSESTLRVEGAFSDSTPAHACAGIAHFVDTAVPTMDCGMGINDCNNNGRPDADDILQGFSLDLNHNALPDECETNQTVRSLTMLQDPGGLFPQAAVPGAPLFVYVGGSSDPSRPIMNVWANGQPLQIFRSGNFVSCDGTIQADTRPGPQTVYFMARDASGGLAATIAVYTVLPSLNVVHQGNALVFSWPISSGSSFKLYGTPSLAGSPTWGEVPGTVSMVNDNYVQSVPLVGGMGYFRLSID